MKSFEQQLKTAKKKQYFLYLGVCSLFFIGLLVITVFILVSRGTRIEIQPDEAVMQARTRVVSGLAIIVRNTLYSFAKKPLVEVSSDGFQTIQQSVADDEIGKLMRIMLMPLPAEIALSTSVDDSQVSWLINGEVLAIARQFKSSLPPGDYQVTVSHPHYQEQTLLLSLSRGEIFKKIIAMQPIQGSLTIKTSPSGASIAVNDRSMGTAPLTLAMPGGYHKVSVTLHDRETIDDVIEITLADATVQRHYRLQAQQARVNISLKPTAGKLLLDGIAISATEQVKVAAGIEHQLHYAKKGYFSQHKTFTISATESLYLLFELAKEMGSVEVVSSPIAELSVNGKVVGMTPLQLSLDAVEQTLTLSKPGFRRVTKIITPSAARVQKVKLTLNVEQLEQLKEAPKDYTHKAGGRLRLFTPNASFTMGAERGELGQRANEFIREVKLSKAFYAGMHEVTYKEYRQYDSSRKGDAKKPVISITWLEAAEFCNWLSQQEGLQPVYRISNKQLQGINDKAKGYRLLTEAEWEWLARKAGKLKQTTFVWGDGSVIPKQAANVADESAQGKVKVFVSKYNDAYPEVAPVGSFTQEPSGLYDQAGNVSEWVHDSYLIQTPLAGKVFADPLDRAVSKSRVLKGANWRSGAMTELRPAFREGNNARRDDLGFRVGRYLDGEN